MRALRPSLLLEEWVCPLLLPRLGPRASEHEDVHGSGRPQLEMCPWACAHEDRGKPATRGPPRGKSSRQTEHAGQGRWPCLDPGYLPYAVQHGVRGRYLGVVGGDR